MNALATTPASGTRADLSGLATAAGVATAAAVCVLWAGREAPLPAIGAAAAFLWLAVEEDVRCQRIPNWLTFSALAAALGWNAWGGGLQGLVGSLGGAALPFALLFVPFLRGWLGAGDVKLVMVLGALWGAGAAAGIVWWAALCGGVLALGLLVVRGGLGDLLQRWWDSLVLSLLARRPIYCAPAADSVAASGFPCGVAIALAAAALQLWGLPWV